MRILNKIQNERLTLRRLLLRSGSVFLITICSLFALISSDVFFGTKFAHIAASIKLGYPTAAVILVSGVLALVSGTVLLSQTIFLARHDIRKAAQSEKVFVLFRAIKIFLAGIAYMFLAMCGASARGNGYSDTFQNDNEPDNHKKNSSGKPYSLSNNDPWQWKG